MLMIYGHFHIYVSRSTVNRYFVNKKWKWKKISKFAFEADIDEQLAFWQFMDQIVAASKQLLCGAN